MRANKTLFVLLTDEPLALKGILRNGSCVAQAVKRHASDSDFKALTKLACSLASHDAAKRMRRAVIEADAKTLQVEFHNGETFRVHKGALAGLDASPLSRVSLSKWGYDFTVFQASGRKVRVPWDAVRHLCDPDYEHSPERAPVEPKPRVAANIRALRKARGISSYELARRTGIARPNIARIENARTSPSLTTLEKIAKALGVPVAGLFE
ncbi:MAG: helix-turn-helix transcriptional regulator [Elusimicrobia bacterium]|nr:helix-turn-helix transcriptional regulator [Elusimicrobiota bacterium]